MLLIQEVNLTWHKADRGSAGAAARRGFALAYPWPGGRELPNVALHCQSFFQHGQEFWDMAAENRQSMATALAAMGITEPQEIERRIAQRLWQLQKYENRHYKSVVELNLANLALEYCGDNLEVTFCYDEQRSGRPRRRGRNKDYHRVDSRMHGRDCLNETAFLLAPGEYGRVIWNERNVDYDTGVWYYQLHVYNILLFPRGVPSADALQVRQPDYEYRQLAELF